VHNFIQSRVKVLQPQMDKATGALWHS